MAAQRHPAKSTQLLLKAWAQLAIRDYLERARQAIVDEDWDMAAATLAALAFAHKPVYDRQRVSAFKLAKSYVKDYNKTAEQTLKRLVKSPIAWEYLQRTLCIL